MIIYPAEQEDNLSEILSTKSSISYASLVEKSANSSIDSYDVDLKALAGIQDKDLYYTQSILVTTSWNKNDDIFDKAEVWVAKNTPTHKPTNLEHNEAIIVGHITSNFPMTEEGLLIDENTPVNDLPNKFHILTGSVIYTGYTDPELKERAQKLISEIESGIKYVSMECFFEGFDYGLTNNSTGEYKVLSRNNETAFLTKHLRAYGGFGEHENYKIGRVLRNITFSGKGFVDKPANPESVIFTQKNISFDKKIATTEILKEKNSNFSEVGVFSNQANLKENIMSLDLDPIVSEVADLKAKIEAMTNASATEAKVVELENTIKAQEVLIQDAKTAIEGLSSDKEEAAKKMNEYMAKKEEEYKKVGSELAEALEALADYKSKMEEMVKMNKKSKRMASLVEAGIDTEIAASTVDKFESLDDEAFEAVTTLVYAKMPPFLLKKFEEDKKKKDEEEAMVMKKKASEENANPEVLETAEFNEEEVNLGLGSDDTEAATNATRADLVDFVRNRLGKKLNKGE